MQSWKAFIASLTSPSNTNDVNELHASNAATLTVPEPLKRTDVIPDDVNELFPIETPEGNSIWDNEEHPYKDSFPKVVIFPRFTFDKLVQYLKVCAGKLVNVDGSTTEVNAGQL